MPEVINSNAKAIVALIMSLLVVLDQVAGISLPGISEEAVTSIISLLTPVFVWLVRNRP